MTRYRTENAVGWVVRGGDGFYMAETRKEQRERERDSGAKKAVGVSWIGYVGIFWWR